MKVLIVVDSPGWAYDHKADSIARNIDGFECKKVYFKDFRWSMALESDVVFLMGYFYFNPIEIPNLFKDKVVSTLTSFSFEKEPIRKQMLNLACSTYARSGAVSKDLFEVLEKEGANSAVLCPNGVEEGVFVPTPRLLGEDRNLKVGLVCSKRDRTWDFKGLESIAKPLFRQLSGAQIEVDPIVVDSFDTRSLRSQREMVEYYHSIDVLISTSHRYSEGTPNPAFEAASCGVPVVSTQNGCIKDLISHGENGFMADGWWDKDTAKISLAQMAKYILQLEEDRPLLRAMGESIRSTVEQSWTWAEKAQEYKKLFNLDGKR